MADTVVSTTKTDAPRDAAAREKRFFFFFVLLCALTIFAGFTPSYYLKDVIHAPPPLSVMTRVHGVIFTAWVLMLVTQVSLIEFNRPALHRRLGLIGAMLFGIVLAVGVTMALNAARLGHAPPGVGAPLVFMIVPLSGIGVAAVLFVAALWNRAQRDAHMRYMLAAFVAMTPPATHRLYLGAGLVNQALVLGFTTMNVLLAVAIFFDFRIRGRVHPAYLWSAAAFAVGEGLVVWAYASPAWLSAAQTLVQT